MILVVVQFLYRLTEQGVAIGAPNNDGTGADAGHVRIYDYDGSSWVKVGVDIDGEATGIKLAIPSPDF